MTPEQTISNATPSLLSLRRAANAILARMDRSQFDPEFDCDDLHVESCAIAMDADGLPSVEVGIMEPNTDGWRIAQMLESTMASAGWQRVRVFFVW